MAQGQQIPNWLIPTVVVMVMLMGMGSLIYSGVNPQWTIPPFVHAAVPAVVTGLIGYLALRSRANGGSNGK